MDEFIGGTIIVIAKAPQPGKVKTRLTPPLDAEQACDVAWACVQDTLAAVARVPARRVLLLDGPAGDWVPGGFEVIAQRGSGLGDRLTAGFTDVGGDAVVIAMDTPQVSSATLASALRALRDSCQSVFGPADDGGFWLLGLKHGVEPAAVFDGIPMSTPRTGAAQLARLHSLGLSTLMLERLRDIDTIEDLLAVAAAHPDSNVGRITGAIEAARSSVAASAATFAERVKVRSLLIVTDVATLGEAPGREAAVAGCDVVIVDATAQLPRRFEGAWINSSVIMVQSGVRRASVHQAVQHLVPGGWLGIERSADTLADELVTEFGLVEAESLSSDSLLVFRRPERTTVHDLLFAARAEIARVDAATLDRQLRGPTPPLVIDTRTHVDRGRSGVIPGSIHIPRTVLEWHLDPTNGYRHHAVRSFDQPIVVVCNGGYSSSLAAANLVRIGFTSVADLIGGMHAWCDSGLPVEPPDHSHLEP